MTNSPAGRVLRHERQRRLGVVLLGMLLPPLVLVSGSENRTFEPVTSESSSRVQVESALGPDVLVLDDFGSGISDYYEVDVYYGVADPTDRDLLMVPTFDIDADGALERTGWVGGNGGPFLWVDGNNNRRVDGAQELFGSASIGPWGEAFGDANGFEVLAQYDRQIYGGNGDGRIDSQDDVWRRLRLWYDGNVDGQSQPGEIQPLSRMKTEWFDLDYVETGERERRLDNQEVARGTFWLRVFGNELREFPIVAIRFRFAEVQ